MVGGKGGGKPSGGCSECLKVEVDTWKCRYLGNRDQPDPPELISASRLPAFLGSASGTAALPKRGIRPEHWISVAQIEISEWVCLVSYRKIERLQTRTSSIRGTGRSTVGLSAHSGPRESAISIATRIAG